MMAAMQRSAHPFAPLVLDDTGSLEAMAAAVMRLHSTLMTVGRCYTTDATGDRAALELGRVESVLAGAFCTIFGQSPADRFANIFDQVTYVADHMAKDHIFEDGNKRTSLTLANKILLQAGAGVLTIRDQNMEQFNEALLNYYNTAEAEPLKAFLYENAIQGLEL